VAFSDVNHYIISEIQQWYLSSNHSSHYI
jgi:hypothetical protein